MRLFRTFALSSLLVAVACGGGQKSSPAPADPAPADTAAESTEAAAPVETAAPAAEPVADPDSELLSLELQPAAEMSRSRGGGGGGASRGGRDYAADQNRRCEDSCYKDAGDKQNSGSPQWGANQTSKCLERCDKQNSMREEFLKCTKPPEECREEFREAWTNQDN